MNINFENGITHPSPGEFDHKIAFAYGAAAAEIMRTAGMKCVLVGTDGRRSGDMLKCAVIAGLLSSSMDTSDCGVCTVGEMSLACRKRACGGILICAALEDSSLNGMRFFGADGASLPREQMNPLSLAANTDIQPESRSFGKLTAESLYDEYASALNETMQICRVDDLSGMKAAIDCANGASSEILPTLLQDCGAKVYLLNASPDGLNVNDSCGINNCASLAEFVRRKGCDVGFALSADGGKCLCMDETGVYCDNDRIFAAAAEHLSKVMLLKANTAVITPSVNSGFHTFAASKGMSVRVVSRGEEHINDIFRREGLSAAAFGGYAGDVRLCGLGGTNTGYSSDGILWLLFVMGLIRRENKPLSEISAVMNRFPQVSVDVDIPDEMREIWKNLDGLENIIDAARNDLSEGVLTVREEPGAIIRITAEGANFDLVNKIVLRLEGNIREICKKT